MRAPSSCSTPFKSMLDAPDWAMMTRSQDSRSSCLCRRYHSLRIRLVRFRFGEFPTALLLAVMPIRPISVWPGAQATKNVLVRKTLDRRRCSRYSPVRRMRTAGGNRRSWPRATWSKSRLKGSFGHADDDERGHDVPPLSPSEDGNRGFAYGRCCSAGRCASWHPLQSS